MVNEAEDALLLLGREIYQRGGLLVRPVLTSSRPPTIRDTTAGSLIPVTRPYLVETLTCAARFLNTTAAPRPGCRSTRRTSGADTLPGAAGSWKLPILSGIVHTPFLRTDGSICEQPGYDAAERPAVQAGRRELPADPAAAEQGRRARGAGNARADLLGDVPLRRRRPTGRWRSRPS